MSDRELLERAAKAAGLRIRAWIDATPDQHEWAQLEVTDETHGEGWNPLTDDGDAFRLAVARRLTVYRLDGIVRVWDALMYGAEVCQEELGTDSAAATRRAIVRAAAGMI